MGRPIGFYPARSWLKGNDRVIEISDSVTGSVLPECITVDGVLYRAKGPKRSYT